MPNTVIPETPTTIEKDTKDPETFRALVINDPHWTLRSPPVFKESYLEHLEGNIDQVFKYARNKNVDCILWTGDIFHLKEPKNNPHSLVSRVVGKLTDMEILFNIPNLGIGGNHDYKHGSLEGGLYGSPLDVLVQSKAYHLLDLEEWLFTAREFKVRAAGGSYLHSKAEHVRDKKKKGANFLISLGHFWLGRETGEFFGEALYGFDFFKDSEADVICVGHHHEDKGVMDAYGKKFVSHGSIAITGAHQHDLARRPAACLIEITKDGPETTILRPKCKPADELLDLEKHKQTTLEKKEIEEFIEQLNSAKISTADPTEILKELAPSQKVMEKALEYIKEAEATE